jgi:hypothetical protein
MNLYYPQLPVGRGLTKGLTADELDLLDARLDESRHAVGRSRSQRRDAAQLVDQLQFSIDLVALLVRDARVRLEGDGTITSVPAPAREQLERDLGGLIERYKALWLAHSRPGGLDDSLSWLENLRAAYVSGQPDPEWGGIHVGLGR